jgi:ABC-type Fe3+-siderophore transport system permease subunit
VRNETLTNIFCGIFLIWFGVVMAFLNGNPIASVNDPIFALGTGTILILLNFVRSLLRLKLSVLTIGLGLLVTIVYAFVIFMKLQLPFLPALLLIAGIALVIGAVRTRNYQSF